MGKNIIVKLALWSLLIFSGISIGQNLENGVKAPPFKLKDVNNKTYALSDYSQKVVVLEWVNFDCPFVRKHYGSRKMQSLQKKYTSRGVVWFSINSSAKGKQGNFSTAEIKKRIKKLEASPTAYLIDENGKIGRLYDAKTTPHIFIIHKGNILYEGAADSPERSVALQDIEKAENYIDKYLTLILEGKHNKHLETQPYGCSVKY